jgi:hypothetical protein
MNVKKLFRQIQDATIGGYCNERAAKKLELEQAITALRPDAIEASELIDALAAGLKLRYENPSECLLRMSLLQGDLERLDQGQEIDASDILASYERQVERRGR